MSHISRLKTKLKDLATLEEALKELGYEVKRKGILRGFSESKKVDLLVKMNIGYDIGFTKKGNEISLEADRWKLAVDLDSFLKKVSQKYAEVFIKKEAEKRGFSVIEEVKNKDGSIKLTLRKI